MSKLVPIMNFATAGLNSDIIPWDLPGSFVTDLSNIRIARNSLSPAGGYSVWSELPVDFNPGHVFYTTSVTGDFWIIPGEDKVYLWDGAVFTDISSTEGYINISDPDYWNHCLLANIPIINHPSNYPEYWPTKSSGIPFEALPWDATNTWADVNERCEIMRSHKSYLFALGLFSGSEVWEDGVRWSSPADIGSVPETWDPLDITNVAGLVGLGSDGGPIIDGLPLRDAFVVYRQSGISIFDYVGGQYVWRIRHLSNTNGLSNRDALVEVKGKHYFIGDGDILVNDGNRVTSLLHNRLRVRFATDFDADSFSNSYVLKDSAYNEIWFCIPSKGSTYATLVYVYNWRDDSWTIREMPDVVSADFGIHSTAPRTWASTNETWANAAGSWSSGRANAFDRTIAGVTKPGDPGTSGQLIDLDVNVSDSDVSFDTKIERVGFALEGLDVVTTIQTVYPHVSGTGSIDIEIGSQDYPGSAIRWKPAVTFRIGIDRKVDVRSTGELHCFRFSLNDVQSVFRLSGMDVKYVLAGER